MFQSSFSPYWYGGGEIVDGTATWPLQGIQQKTYINFHHKKHRAIIVSLNFLASLAFKQRCCDCCDDIRHLLFL